MKLTDYVIQFLEEQGVRNVFGLTGGAVVHLFDSASKSASLKPVFHHHEQAAAFAAEAYARIKNDIGVGFFTTGPGGTNALTGLCAAWLDSVPCLYISGQTRLDHTSHGKKVRQIGTQEFDIVSFVSGMTKYAIMVDDPKMIKYHLQKAVHLARSGRPGPVWIDLPQDLQWSQIDPASLKSFVPSELSADQDDTIVMAEKVDQCVELFKNAKRPLILAGYGVRLSKGQKLLQAMVGEYKIPFLTTWNASDLMPTDNAMCIGRPGIFGQRGANLAMQNCDLLISLGSHLCVSLTGTMFDAFARGAKVVMVDADAKELADRRIRIDLPIVADTAAFMEALLERLASKDLPDLSVWRNACSRYRERFNKISRSPGDYEGVDTYEFVDKLSDELANDDLVVIDGGGTINQITFQTIRTKPGQRLIISAGICSMGSGLPESVGACFAGDCRRTVCLCGDGSFQLNVQELQTVVHHHLPIKLFVINNSGYLSIRNTQDGFLDSNHVGSETAGGMSLPDIQKVGKAYGLKTVRINCPAELRRKIRSVLKNDGPVLCEIMVRHDQRIEPRQGFARMPDGTFKPRPLEDMAPFLNREELKDNMFVDIWPSSRAGQ